MGVVQLRRQVIQCHHRPVPAFGAGIGRLRKQAGQRRELRLAPGQRLTLTFSGESEPPVGAVRPDAEVREIEGLYLTGDTTRSRGIGIDKAARSGIQSVEALLGGKLPEFAGTVRY